jgi:hypothetical protein
MNNIQDRITAIYAAADRAGLPVELKQGLWQQLAQVDTREGRDQLLTRWEADAADWPVRPVTARQRAAMATGQYVI